MLGLGRRMVYVLLYVQCGFHNQTRHPLICFGSTLISLHHSCAYKKNKNLCASCKRAFETTSECPGGYDLHVYGKNHVTFKQAIFNLILFARTNFILYFLLKSV